MGVWDWTCWSSECADVSACGGGSANVHASGAVSAYQAVFGRATRGAQCGLGCALRAL